MSEPNTRPADTVRHVISPRTPGQAGPASEQWLLRELEQVSSAPCGKPPLRALGLLGGYEGEFGADLDAPRCARDVRTARDARRPLWHPRPRTQRNLCFSCAVDVPFTP